MQRGLASVSAGRRVSPGLEQQTQHLGAAADGPMQRGGALGVGGVNPGAVAEQKAHGLGLFRLVQRGLALPVGHLDRGPRLQQDLQHRGVVQGLVEQCLTEEVLVVDELGGAPAGGWLLPGSARP